MACNVDSSRLSIISEEKTSDRKPQVSFDDCDAIYNHKSKSASFGGHKKKTHPLLLGPIRQTPGKMISLHAASKNNLSEFTQRIMSAKLLRVKQVQNQLNEAQNQISELINENRVLKQLLKRQEGALKKYEGNHAELPQFIRSHNEEIRTLKSTNKIIKSHLRESNAKLKEREYELEALRDNYNRLKKLSTEKNLLEREKLQKKVEDLQDVIKEQEEKIQVLSRKVLLESKNYRHHLNIEMLKHKETQKDLNSALTMISRLEGQLMAKEKVSSANKILLKREVKNFMPTIINKSSTDNQSKGGASEDSFLSRDDGIRQSQSDSPESELELLNAIGSSEDTSSPTQDIFPEINQSKKSSQKLIITTENESSKSEVFQFNNLPNRSLGNLKARKSALAKIQPKFSTDINVNAKIVAEKLNEDMETIDNLAQKVDTSTSSPRAKNRLESLIQEVRTEASKLESTVKMEDIVENSSKIEQGKDEKLENEEEEEEEEVKRIVPKRKLSEELEMDELNFDLNSELTEAQQLKLENMTKTWNNMKSKIQEERRKAEEKMKELTKMNPIEKFDSLTSIESPKNESISSEEAPKIEKDFKQVNFTNDSYILEELVKTDKIFNKLKSEIGQKKPVITAGKKPKASTPKPKPQQDIKSFRTESQREPKYLKEFQKEYQKENLLKALKAIDIGKDPNLTSESESEKEDKIQNPKGMKHVRKFSSAQTSKDLMTELFGTRQTDSMKLEYGTIAGVNE